MPTSLSLAELLFVMENNEFCLESSPVEHVSLESVPSVSSSDCPVSSNDSDIDVMVEKDLK